MTQRVQRYYLNGMRTQKTSLIMVLIVAYMDSKHGLGRPLVLPKELIYTYVYIYMYSIII